MLLGKPLARWWDLEPGRWYNLILAVLPTFTQEEPARRLEDATGLAGAWAPSASSTVHLANLVFLGKLYSISPVAALGVHLGFRALLRTGELLSLESKDIVIGPKALNAVLHLGLTKTGVQNPSAGSITLTDMELIQRLALWKASLKHSTPLIPWSPAKFRSIFHHCCADCQLSSYQYKPYSLRRGGATDLWISSQNLVWWPMQDGGLVKRPFEYMFKTALLCFRLFTSVHLFLNASGKTTIFLWVVLSLRCRQEGGVVEWDDLNLLSLQPLFTSSLFRFVSVNAKAFALPTNWLTWKRLTWGCSRFVLFSTNLSCIAKGECIHPCAWSSMCRMLAQPLLLKQHDFALPPLPFLHQEQEHITYKPSRCRGSSCIKCNNIQTPKVSCLFLHQVQQHINPKGVMALLTLSATTYKP